jgi:hypothetical protein
MKKAGRISTRRKDARQGILNGSAAVFMSYFHQVFIASVTYWVTLLWLQFNLKDRRSASPQKHPACL